MRHEDGSVPSSDEMKEAHSVQFMIFSKKYQEIANAIGTQMDHGVTILDRKSVV